MATGTQNMTTYKARVLANTPNLTSGVSGTDKFLRGDNTWSDTLEGDLNTTNDINIGTYETADEMDLTIKTAKGRIVLVNQAGTQGSKKGIYIANEDSISAPNNTDYRRWGLSFNQSNTISDIAPFSTDILPSAIGAYNLGSHTKAWLTAYTGGLWIKSYNSQYKFLYYGMYNSDAFTGIIRYDSGDSVSITDGQFGFLEYSPKNTDATDRTSSTGKYENYYLPKVDIGLPDNVDYSILTSKNEATISQRGQYQLSSGDNINSLSNYGTFYSNRNTVSEGITGSPTASSGYKLYNIRNYYSNTNYDYQIAQGSASSGFIRVENGTNNSWGKWHRFVLLPSTQTADTGTENTYSSTATWSAVGGTTQPVYVTNTGIVTATNYNLSAAVNAGTTNNMVYYSGETAINKTTYVDYIETTNSLNKGQYGIRLSGYSYGDAADLLSGTAGVLGYNDGGIRIEFGHKNGTHGDDAAIIYSYINSTTGDVGGASINFVGQTNADTSTTGGALVVTTPTSVARQRLTIGQNFANTDYTLYVNGTTGITSNVTLLGTSSSTAVLNFSRDGLNYITWPSTGTLALCPNTTHSSANSTVMISSSQMYPGTTAAIDLGKSSNYWNEAYIKNVTLSTGSINRAGISSAYNASHTNALIRMTTANNWSPLLAQKATDGWWVMGHYTSYANHLLVGFLADVDVSGVTNAQNHLDYMVHLLPTVYATNTTTTTNRAFVTSPYASSSAQVGSTSQPVYVNSSGVATAITGAIANNISGNIYVTTKTPPSSDSVSYRLIFTSASGDTSSYDALSKTSRLYLWEDSNSTYLCIGKQGTTGGLTLYSSTNAASRYGNFRPTALTAVRNWNLPDASGWVVIGATAGAGSSSQPVYISSSGVATAITGAIANDTTGNAATASQVTQTAVTASGYTNWRSLIWGASNNSSENFTPSTVTGDLYATQTLAVQPSSGTIRVMNLHLVNQTMDLTAANNGSSSQLYSWIGGYDKNLKNYFALEGYTTPSNGNVTAYIGIRNYNTGLATPAFNAWSGIGITQTKDNVISYSVSAPAKFRNAITAPDPDLYVYASTAIGDTFFHYISLDIPLDTSNKWVTGYIQVNNYSSNAAPGRIDFSFRWTSSGTFGSTYYTDPMHAIGSMQLMATSTGATYLVIKPTLRYQAFFVNVWLSGSSHINRAISVTQTAPTVDSSKTVTVTRKGSVYVNATTSNTTYYILGATSTGNQEIYRAYNSGSSTNSSGIRFNGSTGVLLGAAWNDYAEYRKDNTDEKEKQQPGRCVKENGNGSLSLTSKRLERGCEIISDTFGFAIGQDEENGYNTPIASNGRVLAYPYESIEKFASHIGWPVCSGPDGTVSIMTEEEEEKYPSRIIGTISEIPSYDTWGTGNVKVNGRVWIRIR